MHEAWRLGAVAQGLADLVDAEVQAAVEVDEGVLAPQLLADLFARDHLAGPAGQEPQDFERLGRQAHDGAVTAQFSTPGVELEDAEAQAARPSGFVKFGQPGAFHAIRPPAVARTVAVGVRSAAF